MKLKTRVQSQRDPRWGSILLGYNTSAPYTIYNYGCLITCLANYVDKTPDEVNTTLKNNNGFTTGSGNFYWGASPSLGLTQTYLSVRCQTVPLYSTEVTKLRAFLDSGHPALCEVDFNPSTDSEEQHYVLAVGHTDTEILVVDPWEGQVETWADAAFQRNTYQYRIYDKILPLETGISPTPQTELDACRIDRDRNWTWFVRVCDALHVGANVDTAVAEATKLLTVEQAIIDKDRQLEEAQTQVKDLRSQLEDLNASHNALQSSYNDLQLDFNEDKAKIDDLTEKLQELEKQITTPVYSGWKKALIELVKKLPF